MCALAPNRPQPAQCAEFGQLKRFWPGIWHSVPLTSWVGTRGADRHSRCMSFELLAMRHRRMPGDALFSHRTAGWLHGLDVSPCDPIEVTLPQTSRTSHLAGVSLTRSDYMDSEACEIRGLPTTSVIRTVADLARRGPIVEAVVVVDMAMRAGLVTRDELSAWREMHPHHRGLGIFQRAIDLADAAAESPMETRLRLLLVMSGLPRPAAQVHLRDRTGAFLGRCDLFYPRVRLVIEYDGATHRDSLESDNRRQNRILEAGFRLLRFTAGDVLRTPASVVGQVRHALSVVR